MKSVRLLMLAFVLLQIFLSTEAAAFELTQTEKAWLQKHPVIRIGTMEAWPPLNFVDSAGLPSGIGADYIAALNQRLGGVLKIVPGPFKQNLEQVKLKQLDALMDVTPKPEREKFLNFTRIYLDIPHVIVALRDGPYFRNEDDLRTKTLALEKGFGNVTYFQKKYPSVKIMEYPDTAKALGAVSRGEADAYAGNRAVAAYIMEHELMANLRFQGRLNKPGSVLAIGVRKDWPELTAILDKAIADISFQESREIRRRWVGLAVDSSGGIYINLTKAESTWIRNHPVIKANGGEWPPFIIRASDGKTSGISTDILNLAAGLVGLRVEYVDGPWPQMQTMLQNRKLDLLQCLSKTPEREKLFHFTAPYLTPTDAIFVRKQDKSVSQIEDLKNKTVAVAEGTHRHEYIKAHYPDIQIVTVASPLEGLRKVSNGDATAYIDSQIVTQFEMQKRMMTNIKIGAYFDAIEHDLRFGVSSGHEILARIMDKALATITPAQKQQISARYITPGDEPAMEKRVTTTDQKRRKASKQPVMPVSFHKIMGAGLLVFLVVGMLAIILIRTLRRENVAVSFGSSWFRGIVLAGLTAFVLMVAITGWLALERTKKQRLQGVEENLKGILSVTQDRLALWLTTRTAYMERLGRDPELVEITQHLLQVKPNKRALLASTALRRARFFFNDSEGIFANSGFFIINPDQINIGSVRDTYIGTPNLIARQYPKLLHHAFQGHVGFVPPITSDVSLGKTAAVQQVKKPPSMFFIGPIKDESGKVLAVMTLRVDPWDDLARTMQFFGSRGTGETYAFDDHGRMLSPSRFEDQLREIGLLAEGESSALNIELRDPGFNLIKGQRPRGMESNRPLTYMATSALQLKENMLSTGIRQGHSAIETNTVGYRDYRGVPVCGAWLWNADLDMGLAVEIDVDAALANYYYTRTMILGILGFTLFLSVGAVLLVLIIGERSSRDLMKARDSLEQTVTERTEELKSNQEQLQLILASVDEGIFGVDIEGGMIFVNQAAKRLLGYKAEEIIGHNIHTLVHHSYPDGSHYPADICPMYKAYTEGISQTITDEMLWRKDGTGIPVEYTATPIMQGDKITGAVIAFRDITERKEAETALLEAKEISDTAREEAETKHEQLLHLVQNLPIPTALFDREGAVTALNQAFTDLLGYIIEDIPSIDAHYEPFYPDPVYREQIRKHWNSRIQSSAETGAPVAPMDVTVTSKSGNMFDLQCHTIQVGPIAAAMWIDFTERNKAEREIKQRFDELSRFRRLAVGREVKMIELKKEINAKLKESGLPEKYKIHS